MAVAQKRKSCIIKRVGPCCHCGKLESTQWRVGPQECPTLCNAWCAVGLFPVPKTPGRGRREEGAVSTPGDAFSAEPRFAPCERRLRASYALNSGVCWGRKKRLPECGGGESESEAAAAAAAPATPTLADERAGPASAGREDREDREEADSVAYLLISLTSDCWGARGSAVGARGSAAHFRPRAVSLGHGPPAKVLRCVSYSPEDLLASGAIAAF